MLTVLIDNSSLIHDKLLVTNLSRSNVVTVGVGAAAPSTFQIAVIDLHTNFAVTCPSFNTHTRNVTCTHVHTLCLDRKRGERGREGYKGRYTTLNPTVNNSENSFLLASNTMKEVLHTSYCMTRRTHGNFYWQMSSIFYK